ncbi:sporulation related protein [Breznakibacter xylanolyticus]|uniref:Sporulation related protein n=1 Tax=Breznakibacter xylanolyticus TaxID=990 RepID=A0A2W7MYW0_9BACT|nr:SPOR domain-containing protein [Breznakibacter xylanolyticus]MBN2743582.1 SPOR domain-containing protein [Marinilabiliaceae bacterium]PZX12773.1 sporulation related protein [Breznakibacter xylanolyticus]
MRIVPVALLFTAIMMASCASLTRKGSSSFSDSQSPYAKSTSTSPKPKSNPTPSSKTSSTPTPTPKVTPTAEPAKAVVVREEKVKVVENTTTDQAIYNYYCIIGSFRILDNARNFTQQLKSEGFQPVILENENGLYRISVSGSNQEDAVRAKIADIRGQYPQYADVWLLKKQ